MVQIQSFEKIEELPILSKPVIDYCVGEMECLPLQGVLAEVPPLDELKRLENVMSQLLISRFILI